MNPIRLVLLIVLAYSAALAQAASVAQFAPQGAVSDQSRATAIFASDMVKMGDPTATAPFTIDCASHIGEGRWSDARTWTWQAAQSLKPGERCIFNLRDGLTDLAGEPMTGKRRFEFFGIPPRPLNVLPSAGAQIEEDQAFIINPGGPLNPASVDKGFWCEADGVGHRMPARPVKKDVRDAVLRTAGGMGESAIVVICAERLPAGSKMKLVWSTDIRSQNGTRTDKEYSFIYKVREPFKATLNCERDNATAPCSPLSQLIVNFNAPFDAKSLAGFRLKLPEGVRKGRGDAPQASIIQSVSFDGPFPPGAELTLEIPEGLKDDAGRALSNAGSFPLKIRTGKLPPLVKFPGSFGIIELKEGGVLPVTVRNVEPSLKTARLVLPGSHRFSEQRLTEDGDVIAAMRALEKFEQQTREVEMIVDGEKRLVVDTFYARELSFLANRPGVVRQALPKPGGSTEFEVMGIPLAKPGYHIVEIESQLLGKALLATPKPMYVRTAALVTNMAVHLKLGADNALVWVTALDSGKPVAGADIQISDDVGRSLWQGKTDSKGRAMVDKSLKGPAFLFASARYNGDYSFARSDWNEGIEPWRFGVESWGDADNFKIHTVLDRSLFRAGETVSMKHIARNRSSKGFAFPETANLPAKLVIRHQESGTEFVQPVSWDAQGIAVSQWKIPDSGKLGTYEVVLTRGGSPNPNPHLNPTLNQEWSTGDFRVSEFRVPVFSGVVKGVPARQVAPARVPLAVALSFINGGPARQADVQVSATLRSRSLSFKPHDDYRFNVDLDDDARRAFGIAGSSYEEKLVLDKQALKLDNNGAGQLTVPLADKPREPKELFAEMSFSDPNGEVQTIRGLVPMLPAAVAVGLKLSDAGFTRGDNRAQILVVDHDGRPQSGQSVRLLAKRRIDYSHRRRIVGGFYAYENTTVYKDIGEVCKGSTDGRGLLTCELQISEPGSIYLLAEARDSQGNTALASANYWISGNADAWFAAGNQDRIDVIPEKKDYKAGEIARFQVRTPFREATALIAVEAGGILDSVVQPLSRFKPTVELPVKPEWGPNVYVSVLVVRGRLQPLAWYSFFDWGWREPVSWFKSWWNPDQPTAMVDLAKPAHRFGLTKIDVGTEAFQLKVDVAADKASYRPREAAKVTIKVTTPDGKPAPANTELAFAAVDQALLELSPNDSWNVLDAFMQRREYHVETATAQSQVIGKRHFGKKALPPGGGGGRAPARELFDTLLAWQPRVKLDANGMATLGVTMNDSLTEFTLVAVATGGAGRFGTGSAQVRTRQDLQIISGLPPQVREGDAFQASVTLRNGTARKMTVTVAARGGATSLESRKLTLEPEGVAEASWNLKAADGLRSQTYEFSASEEGSGSSRDTLRIVQQIVPATPVTVQQASFARIDGSLELPAVQPAGALPGKGGLEVSLSPRLATPPLGLKRYFEDYPFSCLEQQASIAVGLHDAKRWQQVVDTLPAYLDSQGLARYFPGNHAGSHTLTAYLLDMASLSGFGLPEDSRERMIKGLTAFAEGSLKSAEWTPGDSLLAARLHAMQSLLRQGKKPLRAASSLNIDLPALPTHALIDWYLVAKQLSELPKREQTLGAVRQALRNRLAYAGSRLAFSTERSDYWWWMMVNGDTNAFRLIEATLDDPEWQADLPRLMQGAMERQVRGRWMTTTANAWARVTIDRFAQQFEREAVSGKTTASFARASAERDWRKAGGDGSAPLLLPWPAAPGRDDKLSIRHDGSGKPWATVQVLAAIPGGSARNAGYRISRTVTPVQEKIAGKVSRGDLWRVKITVEADNDMTWVALTDPIPAGARILGDGDGRDSSIADRRDDSQLAGPQPAYIERSFAAYRAYYAMLPRGRFSTEYTLRLNNAGNFSLPPTRVEAMYAPDVFGEVPNERIVIGN